MHKKAGFWCKIRDQQLTFSALFSFAPICLLLRFMIVCKLFNLQTKKTCYAKAHAGPFQFSFETKQGKQAG